MSDRISLVRWRDAKTDPPEGYKVVKTDVGYAYVGHDGDWLFVSLFESMYAGHELAWPSVWCDPSPPGDDVLTAEDVHKIVRHCYNGLPKGDAFDVFPAAARLRRAIEEAEG